MGFNSKFITIGAFLLLIYVFYDVRKNNTESEPIVSSEIDLNNSQQKAMYTVEINEDTRESEMNFVTRIIRYFFKDEIEASKQKHDKKEDHGDDNKKEQETK